MPDEPELQIVKLPDVLGDEWRTDRARHEAASRRRYREHLIESLRGIDIGHGELGALADAILQALFVVERVDGDGTCSCSCHPQL
ncbi:MAG: hypothetical protein LC792_13905, partial [Actinobacteria bacterium]|nr:hypothetical protein [Actinomycetota bacterium]